MSWPNYGDCVSDHHCSANPAVPTGNLDTTTGSDIVTLLLAMRDSHHTTLLIATHDPSVAARCDRTIQLADGRVQHPGPTRAD